MILAPTLSLLSSGSGAIVRPTFSRDFAGERTLNNGTGPAIAFTRGSAATYFDADGVLQTASNDVPRFDHSGGSSLGLLIEEARTNGITHSIDFANAAWGKFSVTVTANTDLAPDGTTTASTITDATTSAGDHLIDGAGTLTGLTDASIVTFSVFLKKTVGASHYPALRVLFGGGTAYQRTIIVNTNTGAFTVGGSPDVGRVVDAGAYWRVALTASNGLSNTYAAGRIYPAWNSTGSGSTDGTITGSVVAWGAQLEEGAFPTSYIPTTTAAVTRSADSAVVTPISSFYNQSEGTLFAEASRPQVAKSVSFLMLVDETDGGKVTTLETGEALPATQRFSTTGGVGSALLIYAASGVVGTIYKMIGAYALNDFIAAQDGVLTAADTSGTAPTSLTRLVIGMGATPSVPVYRSSAVHIRKVAYYPKRLSNALLQQLTT